MMDFGSPLGLSSSASGFHHMGGSQASSDLTVFLQNLEGKDPIERSLHLEKKVRELSGRVFTLQKSHADEIQAVNRQMESAVDKIKRESERQRDRLQKDMEDDIRSLRQRNAELMADAEKKNVELEILTHAQRTDEDVAKNNEAVLSSELERCRTALETALTDVNTRDLNLALLKEQVVSLQKQLKAQKSVGEASAEATVRTIEDEFVGTLERMRRRANEQIVQLTVERYEQEEKMILSQQRAERYSQQLSHSRTEAGSLRAERDTAVAHCAQAVKDMESAISKEREMQAEVEHLTRDLGEMSSKAQKERSAMDGKLREVQSENDRLRTSLQDATEQIRTQTALLAARDTDIGNLKQTQTFLVAESRRQAFQAAEDERCHLLSFAVERDFVRSGPFSQAAGID
eukprot:NODE_850_length_1738_cov_46.306098_g697_i0.p1 GENE.NODE_850_length_1738_cov_46.306098_g697_i0~~NODE_850_length_1738_cov_46.306098_g697_i0.p1  ORF type:complete len:403 (-),score=127.45 NODE_850_length_1738_cov_46.306098_g697_i0:500-1708(-)